MGANNKKKTHEEFIEELKLKNLDYILLNKYVNSTTILQVSTKHGICEVKPQYLLNNYKPNIKHSIDKNSFALSELKEVHGDLYDYSLFQYNGYKEDIKIICKKHGVRTLKFCDHLGGRGCNSCGRARAGFKLKHSLEDFIKKSKKKHGNRYDYSNSVYTGAINKINVFCKIHGEFPVTAADHIRGTNCDKCGRISTTQSARESATGWTWKRWEKQGLKSKNFDSFKVYIIKCWNDNEEFYKIGRTFLVTTKRFRGKTILPYNYEILQEIIGTAEYIFNLENKLKREHKKFKYKPNLKFNGMYECFTKIDFDLINKHLKND